MDAFERNKFNQSSFIEYSLSKMTIISYGFISAIDFNTVIVTATVSDTGIAKKIRCVFMNSGDSIFAVCRKPVIGMSVLVLSPNKAAEGMYETSAQLIKDKKQEFIVTGKPAVFSSQLALCIPVVKANFQSLNNLVINNTNLTLEIKNELFAELTNSIEIDLKGDSSIELHEGTEHFRGCYGNMEETFGMVEGISGTEKEGDYIYKKTYGKFSSVEKNYESGAKITVGKAYEKPFLADKGALLDSSAPVTMEFGAGAPVTLSFGAPVALQNNAPLTLTFGESVLVITADAENGLDIALTGSTKVNISAAAGKFSFSNSTGSLKDILDKVADLFTNMTTIGPNVVPGAPYTAGATPATAALAAELKTLVAGLLE
jgi:hypothetical protein